MKFKFLIFFVLFKLDLFCQKDVLVPKEKTPYDRKEEILFENKRYRIHNNYITLGGGYLGSSIRDDVQRCVNADFQFHIRLHQFQCGAMMSGEEFLSNNNTQIHVGYGLRKETQGSNFAAFIGPSYFTGVQGAVGQPASFYDGFGIYASGQAIYKLAYDIGLGLELFLETNYKYTQGGIKFIAFFSGAYRGTKKRHNPNVKPTGGS